MYYFHQKRGLLCIYMGYIYGLKGTPLDFITMMPLVTLLRTD